MSLREAVKKAGLKFSEDVLDRAEAIWKKTEFLSMIDVTHFPDSFDEGYVNDYIESGISCVPMGISKRHQDFQETLLSFLTWNEMVERRGKQLVKVSRVEDIDRARKTHRLGIFWHLDRVPIIRAIEPAYMQYFRDHEYAFKLLYDLGLRIAQLVYYKATPIGDGAGESRDAGLTDFGREVVRTMNRMGVTIDLSHAGPKACLDAIETSDKPMLFSHAGCAALTKVPRNPSDDVLKALGQQGGVFGVPFFAEVITLVPLGGDRPWVQPTLEDWLKHMDHAIEIMGIDHVGFGPDNSNTKNSKSAATYMAMIHATFNKIYVKGRPSDGLEYVEGMAQGPSVFPAVFAAMVKHGYGEEEITKIMGANFKRVLAQTWK